MSQPRPPTPEGCPEPYGDCSCLCHICPGTMHITACCHPEGTPFPGVKTLDDLVKHMGPEEATVFAARGNMKVTYTYDIESLTPSALAYLRHGFCVENDENHLAVSKWEILDMIYDSGNGLDLEEIPDEVWTALNLPPDIRAEIEALWVEDEDAEVVWK